MYRIKKSLCLLLAVLLLAGSFSVGFTTSAAPALVKTVRHGRTLVRYQTYFSKKANLSRSQYSKSGKLLTLSPYKSIDILGKDKSGGNYYYIRFYNKTAYVYGYIARNCAYIENRYHYKSGTLKATNPYYKYKQKLNYCVYKSMPFYQYNQTGNGDWINGLRYAYSCGPQTVATVLSALKGSPIFPEDVMVHMPRSAINGAGFGSNISTIVPGIKSYIRSKHGLEFDYKCISPNKVFDYLKSGYIVILGVENLDGLALFTGWSHYIVLAGYDNMGNVITVNTNLRTSLFDSFSSGRIQANIVNSYFYNTNTIAFKYTYNDKYTAYKNPYKTTIYKKCSSSQHYGGKGKVYSLHAGKIIKVLGERGDDYYVYFHHGDVRTYGFIPKSKIVNPVTVSANSTSFTYSGGKKVPKLTIKTMKGKVLNQKYYQVTYPQQSVNVGTYTLKIKFNAKFKGTSKITYKVLPPATTISAVEVSETALKATWNSPKAVQGITGYELQYANNSAFKNAQSQHLTTAAQTEYLLEGIDTAQPYYWRIRSYKTTGGIIYYSAWSKAYESAAFVPPPPAPESESIPSGE